MYSFGPLLFAVLLLLSSDPIRASRRPDFNSDDNFNQNPDNNPDHNLGPNPDHHNLDNSVFDSNHNFVLNGNRGISSPNLSESDKAFSLSSTADSSPTNRSEANETISPHKSFNDSIGGNLDGRLSGRTESAAAAAGNDKVGSAAEGRPDLHNKNNESRVYDFSFDRKSEDNSFTNSLASGLDGGSIRGSAESELSAEISDLDQLRQPNKFDRPGGRFDQANQLNIISQLEADQFNQLNNHPNDHHNSKQNLSHNLNKPINRNKFNQEEPTRSRQANRHGRHSIKHNKFKRMSRSRRSSVVHYANNVSSIKKGMDRKNSDGQLIISIPHRLQAELISQTELANLKILSHLNITPLYLSDNSSDYNSTNPTIYVELPPSLKVFFYCVYTLIFFVGLIGNSLNIYVVYSNKSMYNVTYFFITNLAMSDILLCLFSVPITPMYLLLYKHWPFGKLLCHLLPFSQGVSVYVSAFTLMSIAVDRYFVIIFPFKKRMSVKMCGAIIVIIWISACTLTLPYAIFMHLAEIDDGDDGTVIKFCEEAWPHDASRRTFSTCTSVIQFIVPFVIIAFCYSKVCSKLKIRAKFKPGAKSARKEELERERSRRTNRMLIAMVIIFGLAWLPLNVHNLVVDFYDTANNWPYIRCFFLLAHSIAMSCTCYNFCLYAYLNDHFRKQFKDVLPCFDLPFFQRARTDTHQTTQPTAAHLQTPSAGQLNATSVMPLTSTTKELMTKTEPSTKQILLTDDDANETLNNNNKNEPNNNRLAQQNSLCSEPATSCVEERPLQAATAKCPCSTSYPNFQSAGNNSSEQQQLIGQESSGSTSSSSKQLIKSLRNKLRFSGENSFEEQAIALNDFTLADEPNNNSLIRTSDQTSLINSVPNLPVGSPTNHNNSLPNNPLPNNDKCNTIFLGGLNENNLTLKMDNV